MVDGVASTSSNQTYQTAGDRSAASLANDFDDFLVLLTTQLQHQDPMDPLDSNQFTQQLVQFSGVEQQIRTNQNLETLAALTMMSNQSSLASYLGKEALVPRTSGETDGASGIQWRYHNETAAEKLTLEVRNDQGDIVYTGEGKKAAGVHDFEWDGKLSNGEFAPAGEYDLKVVAEDAAGKSLDTGIAVRSRVQSVDLTGTDAVFVVGPNLVSQDEIIQLFSE